jgi:hypothetical protein
MTYSGRRALFMVSSTVFLLASIPLLFYTLGYRFSLSELSFRKTGGIFVHSRPAGTILSVDTHTKTTSYLTGNAFIQNLQPGEHAVKVSKTGFQEWNKILTVEAQNVAEAYPLLLPLLPQRELLSVASSSMLVSIHQTPYILLWSKTGTPAYPQFFDTSDKTLLAYADASSRKIAEDLNDMITMAWNENNTRAIAETARNWLHITRNGNGAIKIVSLYAGTPLASKISKKPHTIMLHPLEDRVFFILADNTFSRWDAETQTLQQILQSIAGFTVVNNELILWDTQSNLPYRTTLDTTHADALATTTVEGITRISFLQNTNGTVLASDKGLLFADNETKTIRHLAGSFNKHALFTTAAYAVWWSEHAIYIYWTVPAKNFPVFQNIRMETIYKTNGTITAVAQYPEENYLLVQEDDAIYTLELDGRGNARNKQLLFEGAQPMFHVLPDNRTIYILNNGSLFSIALP